VNSYTLEKEGFSIEYNTLSSSECDQLICILSNKSDGENTKAGIRNLMSNEAVAGIANSTRIRRIASRILGNDAVPYRATMFNKSGDVNWLVIWHQDTALPLANRFQRKGWGPWSKKAGVSYAHAPTEVLSNVVALRIHLDDSTSENGPLRVIPGSHKLGVLSEDEILKHAKVNNPVECIVPKGSVMAMRPLMIHASSKASNHLPRRVLHIEYSGSLEIASGVRLALA